MPLFGVVDLGTLADVPPTGQTVPAKVTIVNAADATAACDLLAGGLPYDQQDGHRWFVAPASQFASFRTVRTVTFNTTAG